MTEKRCIGDLCGSCASTIVGLKEADKEAALAKAAAKFTGKPKLSRGKHKRKVEKNLIAAPPPVIPAKAGIQIPNDGNIIILRFQTEADHKLLAALEALSQQYRRTPDQQILWLCQNAMDFREKLIKEAEG